MSEPTRRELWADFIAAAENATPNSPQTATAQFIFKKLMGLSDAQARNPHLSLHSAKSAFTEAVAQLVTTRSGQELQIPASYETIKSMLPVADQKKDKGIGQVLNKLELQFGLREPVMGCK